MNTGRYILISPTGDTMTYDGSRETGTSTTVLT